MSKKILIAIAVIALIIIVIANSANNAKKNSPEYQLQQLNKEYEMSKKAAEEARNSYNQTLRDIENYKRLTEAIQNAK